jgi:hypothetical protein
MKFSKKWTTEERLRVIAACATVVLKHLDEGGRYGDIGLPNMEAIRIIATCHPRELEAQREYVESMVRAANVLRSVKWEDADERLVAIRDFATAARDHAMSGGEYGAPGVPTMEMILVIATGPYGWPYALREQIAICSKKVKPDTRSGQEAFDTTVAEYATSAAKRPARQRGGRPS